MAITLHRHTHTHRGVLGVHSVQAALPTSLLILNAHSQQEHAAFLPTVLSVGHPGFWKHPPGLLGVHLMQPLHIFWHHHRHCLSSPHVVSAGEHRACWGCTSMGSHTLNPHRQPLLAHCLVLSPACAQSS